MRPGAWEPSDGSGPDSGAAESVAAAVAAAVIATVVEAGLGRAPFRQQSAQDLARPPVRAATAGGGGLDHIPATGRRFGATDVTPGSAESGSRVPGAAAGLRQQQRRTDRVSSAQRPARAHLPVLPPALPTGRQQDGQHQPIRGGG